MKCIETIITIKQTTFDIPNDAPVVYLTRDTTCDGTLYEGIDVWVEKPRRTGAPDHKNAMWLAPEGRLVVDGLIGTYSLEAIRARFHVVPDGAEMIVVDNRRVN